MRKHKNWERAKAERERLKRGAKFLSERLPRTTEALRIIDEWKF